MHDVADAVGMEYANFHARVIGRTRFKAAEMSALIREIPDCRLCDLLLRDTPFIAVPRPEGHNGSRTIGLREAARLTAESAAAVQHLSTAAVRGYLEPKEYEQLAAHITEAERAVAAIRFSLFALAPVSGPRTADRVERQAMADVSRSFAAADG